MKKEKLIKGTARVVCIVFAILALVGAVVLGEASRFAYQEEEVNVVFNSYEKTFEERYLEFLFISDEFAFYEVNESQKFYFVLDEEMVPSIICIDDKEFKNYEANYKYTFDDTGEVPDPGLARVEGYPVEIDESLKELGIEYFNMFWGEEILTEENFEEYVGEYYLDASLTKKIDDIVVLFVIGCAIFAFCIGIILLVLLCLNKKQVQEPTQEIQQEMQQDLQMEVDSVSETNGEENSYFNMPAQTALKLPPVKENKILGIIGALVGATIGCIAWAALYRLGYMASIIGLLTGWLSMEGYRLLAKKRGTFGNVISIMFSVLAIIVGNYIGYAWVITDSINESTPGRGEFFEIMRLLPQLLTEYEAWGDFAKDLAIGFILVLIAVVGTLKKTIKK